MQQLEGTLVFQHASVKELQKNSPCEDCRPCWTTTTLGKLASQPLRKQPTATSRSHVLVTHTSKSFRKRFHARRAHRPSTLRVWLFSLDPLSCEDQGPSPAFQESALGEFCHAFSICWCCPKHSCAMGTPSNPSPTAPKPQALPSVWRPDTPTPRWKAPWLWKACGSSPSKR